MVCFIITHFTKVEKKNGKNLYSQFRIENTMHVTKQGEKPKGRKKEGHGQRMTKSKQMKLPKQGN